METSDLTIEILRGIRSEMSGMRTELKAEIGELRTEMRATRTELKAELSELRTDTNSRFEELTRRVVESEIRTSTAITDLAGTVRDMTSVLRASHDLRPRLERCERDIEELKRRPG